MTKIMMSAGEVSGDIHGARLVEEIKKIDPTIQFLGMGHSRMAEAGVDIKADLSVVSTIGFIEPLRYLPQIVMTYFKMKKLLKTERPDVLIPIDYQGYHMLLIKAAKKVGVPVIYYIAPQEWQWGTEEGGRSVIENTDRILSIFKEEELFYNRLGGHATYIGHPIIDLAQSTVEKWDFYRKFGIDEDKRIISIFPGSRPQELKHTFPMLLEAAKQLSNQFDDLHIFVSIVSPKFEADIKATVRSQNMEDRIKYYANQNQCDLIANTTLSLTTSGTITLEHAVLGTPFIANYRFGKLSFWLATKILGEKVKKIKFISLPNIFLDRKIAPEFLQGQCTPDVIASEAISLLTNPANYDAMKSAFQEVRNKMGTPGVIARAATEIVRFLKKR